MSLLESLLLVFLMAAGLFGGRNLSAQLGKDFAEGMAQYKEFSKWRK